MKAVVSPSADLATTGRRLDASYHASDGVLAARFIHEWGRRRNGRAPGARAVCEAGEIYYGCRQIEALGDLCISDGVFIGGRSRRIYVDDPDHGVPFLSSSDMLLASFDGVRHISRKQPNLESLLLKQDWVLISRSGTIGNVVFSRPNMEGMAGSEHIMRVVADPDRVLPGYLYTFLTSSHGQALLKSGTFGSVVDTISPEFVSSVPIPRLDRDTEERIHELIEHAAALRVEADKRLARARAAIDAHMGLVSPLLHVHSFATAMGHVEPDFSHRLDSFCYVGYVAEALKALEDHREEMAYAPDVGFRIYNPPLFRRMFACEGFPYMSGVEIFTTRPSTNRYLSRRQPGIEQYLVTEGMVLVQAAGQRYGLITTPVFVTKRLSGVAATSDIVRIVHRDPIENGYICALLSSEFGRRLALRYTYGTSIPRLDVPGFSQVRIPWPPDGLRREVGTTTVSAYNDRELANQLESQAQALLVAALGTDAST